MFRMFNELINPRISFSPATKEALLKSNTTIVITGARGWIGTAALEMLESVFAEKLSAKTVLYGEKQGSVKLRSGVIVDVRPLSEIRRLGGSDFLLAHFAFLTREHVQSYGLQKYIEVNRAISSLVLDFAKRSVPSGLFVPSSGAIYDENGQPEEDLYTNPYGFLKRQDEIHFSELDVDSSKMALIRLFNLSGPFLNKPSGYVLGTILQDLSLGTAINLRADYEVTRSYIHVRDLIEIAFSIMLGTIPSPGVPFDTAGERVIEIGELAILAASVLGVHDVVVNRPVIDKRKPRDRYVGDGQLIMEIAKAQRLTLSSLENQILDTASYLRSLSK